MPKCSIIFILFALFFVQCYRADKNCLPPCEKLANNFYFHNNNKYILKNRLFFEKKATNDDYFTNNPYTYQKSGDTNIIFLINEQNHKNRIYTTIIDTTAFSFYVLASGYQRTMFRNVRYEMEGSDSVFVAESINFSKRIGDWEDGIVDSLYHYYYRREKSINSNRNYFIIYTVSRDTAFDVKPYRAEALAIWDCIEVRE